MNVNLIELLSCWDRTIRLDDCFFRMRITLLNIWSFSTCYHWHSVLHVLIMWISFSCRHTTFLLLMELRLLDSVVHLYVFHINLVQLLLSCNHEITIKMLPMFKPCCIMELFGDTTLWIRYELLVKFPIEAFICCILRNWCQFGYVLSFHF